MGETLLHSSWRDAGRNEVMHRAGHSQNRFLVLYKTFLNLRLFFHRGVFVVPPAVFLLQLLLLLPAVSVSDLLLMHHPLSPNLSFCSVVFFFCLFLSVSVLCLCSARMSALLLYCTWIRKLLLCSSLFLRNPPPPAHFPCLLWPHHPISLSLPSHCFLIVLLSGSCCCFHSFFTIADDSYLSYYTS